MQRLLGRVTVYFFGAGSLPASPPAGLAVTAMKRSARTALVGLPQRWFAPPGPEVLGQERTQDVLVIGFCAAFSLIGWLMILQGAGQINRAREVAAWPKAQGRIETVEVRPVAGAEGVHWRPQVVYTYSVEDRFLTGTRLSDGKAPFVNDLRGAQAYVARYPPQTPVAVHYNPAHITEAVIDVRMPSRVYLNLAFGMALACLGPLLLICLSWPGARRGRAASAVRAREPAKG